ncbi:MAG: efflux RND transporter permease subunit [Rhodomicrobiaceae bacterium]
MFDIFIRRPVLAIVVSLLIFLGGLRAVTMLDVRQYPYLQTSTITITTTYPGADAETMRGFVSQPIENAVSGTEGIDYLTSSSAQGVSTVTVFMRLNADPSQAVTDVLTELQQVRSLLPTGINDPVVKKSSGRSFAAVYLSFTSKSMNPEQITDYVARVVTPQLAVVNGVSTIDIYGGRIFAMRVWLDPVKLGQYALSASDVVAALRANHFQAASGTVKGVYDVLPTVARTDLQSVEAFRQLVVKSDGTKLIRLSDLGTVELGAQNADSAVFANGEPAIFAAIQTTPDANPINVVGDVRKLLPGLQRNLPPGLDLALRYDSTIFITASIREVLTTVGEATAIVLLVIFLFLGSMRSVLIPIVTIPLSLIGIGIALFAFGFSINLLTLLAMVLAIGLVVDDAIVVVENIHRHIERGLTPFQAAIRGTREIAGPVISMTITLAAVYSPIALLGGLTGALFKEFALTLAGAVIISGIIALTLSPMMCSRLLRPAGHGSRMAGWLDRRFTSLQHGYARLLSSSLNDRPTTVVFVVIILAMIGLLATQMKQELAPEEDQGVVFSLFNGASDANIDYMREFAPRVERAFQAPETDTTFVVAGFGNNQSSGFGGVTLKPWDARTRPAQQLIPAFQAKLDEIPAIKGSVISPPPLPTTGSGFPVQFVVSTTGDYQQLAQVTDELLNAAKASGQFLFVDSDLKFDTAQTIVDIDRPKAASLGVRMSDIGTTLATMTGGNYVDLINLSGRSYQVIPETPRRFRLTPEQLGDYYVKAANGASVPLSNIVSIHREVTAQSLPRFNQLNAATISGVPMIGVSVGDALSFLQTQAAKTLPAGFSTDYAGGSRQYVQEGNALLVTFAFALIVIYLVLAAQYESFRDPLVILVSVPLSIVGALIPLAIGLSSFNIYSQIGLVTLIGLITKHGILMCEVARERQEENDLDRRAAIEAAAALRLRPILMTTAAMVVGLVPLLIASGAGAASRSSIAVVIVFGMSIGTLFTLFVLPAMYTFIASDRRGFKARMVSEEQAISEVQDEGAETSPGS